jgi:AcrR family transcriptional regulator
MAVAVTSKPKKLAPSAKAKAPLEPLRDAERTRQALLAAAEVEFSTKGLAGARVDVIAEQAAANKRMLYYYFGSKEDLYLAVLERAYGAMRETERQLNLTNLEPLEAIRTLVEFKFDYCQEHQQIIALLAGENMLGAVHLKRSRRLREINLSLVDEIRAVLEAGVAKGDIKPSLDPVHLYISMSALSYFYFSNSATLSAAFGRPLASAAEQKVRRTHCVDVIMSYVTAR